MSFSLKKSNDCLEVMPSVLVVMELYGVMWRRHSSKEPARGAQMYFLLLLLSLGFYSHYIRVLNGSNFMCNYSVTGHPNLRIVSSSDKKYKIMPAFQ